jgi:4-amino-4-deoxy-L-arabinose transferase-like glycosyltransferase
LTTEDAAAPAPEPLEPPAVVATPEGAPARPRDLRLGLGLGGLGVAAPFFLMSQDGRIPGGLALGLLATLLAAAGLLECLGLLRALPGDPALALLSPHEGEPVWQSPRVMVPVAVVFTLLGVILGPTHLALPIALALLALLVSGLRRPALFVFAAASLLQLPMLGEFGLWDPWETHYGEVAREILARDDWITLWWAQDELFRSKPVFVFWIEALFWGLFGVPYGADANPGHPEWVIRLPHYLLTMAALMASYAALAKNFSRRAAVLGCLVLATTPYFYFLSHQAITDMPFVSTMTVALALLMLAVEEDPAREGRMVRIGPLAFSAQSVLLAALVLVTLPQVLYLVSRNLTWVWADGGFWAHKDEFLYGSAGNAGIPGNPAHRTRTPYLNGLAFQPAVQGLLWLAGLAALVFWLRRERRVQAHLMFGFYLFASFAWMAKGIPGFALPGLIAALYLFAAGRASLLGSGQLRVGKGILLLVVTGFPWYVAMFGRLGPYFTDRLFIHDHLNRLTSGVHGDTGSVQYFLWQLGYGAFPWFALFPIAFVAWLFLGRERLGESTRQGRTAILLSLWGASAFVLFNAMTTKFHHYIFPAVPPFALLTGVVLERWLGEPREGRKEQGIIALCVSGALLLVLGVGGLYGNLRGIIPESVGVAQKAVWIAQNGPGAGLCALLLLAGLGALGAAYWRSRDGAPPRGVGAGLTAAIFASSTLVAFAGRDLSFTTTERPLGHEHFIQLFIYNYGRPFPDHLDYRPILSGFAVAAFGLLVLAAWPRLRRVAGYALVGMAFWLSAWALNVYMIDLTPHWGQRELVKRYYDERSGPSEPLIAWQMNWKGENLYTGNRVHVFVQLDNKAVTKWMDGNKGKRAYFVLEHSRLNNFKRMMGKRTVEVLTTVRDNNKFLLARAQI